MPNHETLADVSGIGPKTLDKLAALDITDVTEFCKAYYLQSGETVHTMLHSPRRVNRYFFKNPPTSLDDHTYTNLPVSDACLVASMAFARDFGTEYSDAAYLLRDYETVGITPADIEWADGAYLESPRRHFGVVYNPACTTEEANGPHIPKQIDTQPTTVTVDADDDRVQFQTPQVTHQINANLLQKVSDFLNVDYTNPTNLENVRVHPSETSPVYFESGTDYPLVLAPIITPTPTTDEGSTPKEPADTAAE